MYKLYLKKHLKSLIIWMIVLVVFILAAMQKFEAFQTDASAADMTALIDSIPKVIKIVYGLDGVDITNIDGYYAVVALYFQLMLAVYAGILGAKLIYEEEDLKTSEFLFVKPVSRNKVLLTKFLGALTAITFINIFVFISVYFYNLITYDAVVTNFWWLCAVQYLICIFTLTLGMLFTTTKYNKYGVIALSGIILSFFSIKAFASIQDFNAAFISPFSAFDNNVLVSDSVNIVYVIYYLILSVICFSFSFYSLNKKDIIS